MEKKNKYGGNRKIQYNKYCIGYQGTSFKMARSRMPNQINAKRVLTAGERVRREEVDQGKDDCKQ